MKGIISFSLILVKSSACLSVAGGITICPIGLSSLSRGEDNLLVKEKEPDILIVSSTRGSSLGLVNTKILLEKVQKKGEKLTFKEVGMKWGGKILNENDILFSPCQDGDYYLMRWVAGYQYKLDDGTSVTRTLRCQEMTQQKYKNLKYVSMKWHTPYRSGSITPDKIALGSCSISRINELNFQITCYDGFVGGRATGDVVLGTLTIVKDN